jgi:hypothetical protein
VTDRIEELQRLHEAATRGPWRADVTPPGPCGQVLRNESVVADHAIRDIVLVARRGTTGGVHWFKDASYIVAMRNALPALLRVARAARRCLDGSEVDGWHTPMREVDVAELREALGELEREQ